MNIEELLQRIEKLEVELARRDIEIAELKSRLNQNSQNSSKPPSSDKPWLLRSGKAPTGKKRGAQPGHKGVFREPLATKETDTQMLFPVDEGCLHCSVGKIIKRKISRRHQVWEIPEIKPRVTEYQVESGRCNNCGRRSSAELPTWVPKNMLGPRAQALV